MKYRNDLIFITFALNLTASVSYSLMVFPASPQSDMILNRIKRNGGKECGADGRSSSCIPKHPSFSPHKPSDSVTKQTPNNHNYNPNASYPQQPGQQSHPGQHSNHGQIGVHFQQTGYDNNYDKIDGLGNDNSKGMGSIGAGVSSEDLGAAANAYGGYELGKIVGALGRNGNYGYYNDRYQYVRCDPPSKIVTDPQTKITYIPKTITYDARCEYYDQEPPLIHPNYNESSGYYMNAALSVTAGPTVVTTLLPVISVLLFGNVVNRFQTKCLSHLLFT